MTALLLAACQPARPAGEPAPQTQRGAMSPERECQEGDPATCFQDAIDLMPGNYADQMRAYQLLNVACSRGVDAACGDPKKVVARGAYKRAMTLVDQGDCRSAIPLLLVADRMIPGTHPKYRLALCLDKLGRGAEAKPYYEQVIQLADPERFPHMAEWVEVSRKRAAELAANPQSSAQSAPPPPPATARPDGAAMPASDGGTRP